MLKEDSFPDVSLSLHLFVPDIIFLLVADLMKQCGGDGETENLQEEGGNQQRSPFPTQQAEKVFPFK